MAKLVCLMHSFRRERYLNRSIKGTRKRLLYRMFVRMD